MDSSTPNEDVAEIKGKLKAHSEQIRKLQEGQTQQSEAIASLQQSSKRLEEGQMRHDKAIGEISEEFGGLIRQVAETFDRGKSEMLSTMKDLSTQVMALDVTVKSWQPLCEQKHRLVDFRLGQVEGLGSKALADISEMGENTKVNYIKQLQVELAEFKQGKVDSSKNIWALVTAVVTGLLGGTGGTLLIKWLIGG